MKLICEVKSVQSRSSVSGDKVFKIILVTHEPMAMDLGKIPMENTFSVEFDLQNNTVLGG